MGQHLSSRPIPFSKPLIATSPDPVCEAIVIVPARDEAAGITTTLAALAAQVDRNGRPLDPRTYEILILANNCRDDTAAIVRHFARQHPELAVQIIERTFPTSEANVGTARRLLMDEACRRLLAVGRPRGVITSTDADTQPDPTWLAATLREVAAGADAVGGRIRTDATGLASLDDGARRRHLRDVGYRFLVAELEGLLDPLPHDPWPRHYQHFGASIAITAAAYRDVGGLPAVSALEDVALALALDLAGARLRHSPALRVVTSTRVKSHAVRGFATQFREWSALHAARAPQYVESPAALVARLTERRQLRELWARRRADRLPDTFRLTALANRLQLPAPWPPHRWRRRRPSGSSNSWCATVRDGTSPSTLPGRSSRSTRRHASCGRKLRACAWSVLRG
jgi:hypothetical protein